MNRDEKEHTGDDAGGGAAKTSAAARDSELSSRGREPGRLRMEIDILKETMGLPEKDFGVGFDDLTNMGRFAVADALKDRWLAGLSRVIGLPCSRREYGYHRGETGQAAPNLPARDFYAVVSGVKPLTDLTEFVLADGKLYLSRLSSTDTTAWCRPIRWEGTPDAGYHRRRVQENTGQLHQVVRHHPHQMLTRIHKSPDRYRRFSAR
jgi:hypothetical protein